jgi:tRNA threonylcarbamoyladenosine biosynthesis protein TsaB
MPSHLAEAPVVQGLAFGADVKVLPVDTLLAVANEAHFLAQAQGLDASRILAALDARMGEVYVCNYDFDSTLSSIYHGYSLKTPQNLLENLDSKPTLLAGNIRPTLDAQLPDQIKALPHLACLPTASALLRLAPNLIAAGSLVDAEHALPSYIRDKVALTTAEREAHNT